MGAVADAVDGLALVLAPGPRRTEAVERRSALEARR